MSYGQPYSEIQMGRMLETAVEIREVLKRIAEGIEKIEERAAAREWAESRGQR